jgi:hypothetical protein
VYRTGDFAIAIVVHAFEQFFLNFYFYGLFNAEFREDFRHGNNSSVTSKSPFLPKFKNIFFLKFIYSEKAEMILKYALKKSLRNANEDFRHGKNSSVTLDTTLSNRFYVEVPPS